jgi:hypothetical protein
MPEPPLTIFADPQPPFWLLWLVFTRTVSWCPLQVTVCSCCAAPAGEAANAAPAAAKSDTHTARRIPNDRFLMYVPLFVDE